MIENKTGEESKSQTPEKLTVDKFKIKEITSEIPKTPTQGQPLVSPSNMTSDESSYDSSDYEESKDDVYQMDEIRSRMTVQVGDLNNESP